ncbi:MAG: hypothetical protein A2Y15_09295 [Clostridiales bacterium GWF2_36_10]|nr:MAG: hypothetical protein A2Y15_09295 [Clostridiales bacterium GWF2_36_10]HAN21425.1 hypothetical protein [Clostridiales bacterium]
MSEDFSDKVKTLLEDPDMLAKIISIAGSLGGGKTSSPAVSPEPSPTRDNAVQDNPLGVNNNSWAPPESITQFNAAQVISKIPDVVKPPLKQDPRLALLNSLKPFLRKEKQVKIDNLSRALSVTSLIDTFKKK